MSSIEERLARDIAAVTGGVVVTDSDIEEAREIVGLQVEGVRKRDRRRGVIAVVAAVVVTVAGFAGWQALGTDEKDIGPAQSGPVRDQLSSSDQEFLTGSAPTAEALAGVWRVDNGRTLLSFDTSGNMRIDDYGQLFGKPAIEARYSIEGDQVTARVVGGEAGCQGQEIVMRITVPDPGAARVLQTQPGSGECAPEQGGRWVLEHMLPASPSYADLRVPADGKWQAADGQAGVIGVWFAEGGKHLLELMPDGSYHVAAGTGDLVDVGRWTLNGSRLSLVSDGTGSCRDGDRLVLGNVELQGTGGYSLMQAAVDKNTCGGAWTPKVWILLPTWHP